MQICKHCKISIRGNKKCCPLCGGVLTGEATESVYPQQPEKGPIPYLSFKIICIAFAALELAFLTVHLFTGFQHMWVTVVLVSAIVVWVDLLWLFYENGSLILNLNWQVWLGSFFCLWLNHWIGGPSWAICLVFPFSLLALALVTLLLGFFTHARVGDFGIFIVLTACISYVQLIFLLQRMNPLPQPALCSIVILTVLSLVLAIFWFREMGRASHRLFHF